MKHPTDIKGVYFRIGREYIIGIRGRGLRICATKCTYLCVISLNPIKKLIVRLSLNISTAVHTFRNRRRYIVKISVSTDRHRDDAYKR